jgi:hypothetical protein
LHNAACRRMVCWKRFQFVPARPATVLVVSAKCFANKVCSKLFCQR